MGLYDRTYMTDDDEPLGTGGSRRWSGVTLILIINVVVWVVWQFAQGARHRGFEPNQLAQFMGENFTVSLNGLFVHYRVHTLITYALSHVEISHIFWNLLFFWFLAEDVERVY